ncbi:glycosyltransferase family 1 protein [Thiorhodococcus mannitoliphagus]|uniref:Glycosyltransferase family 1 protein n=1 Tax=Thiorhodococcus mannitoliphagus TaxID=329406 RepID=A0A6P1DS75_9GAMM|nr:glycosyltransferase family 1 protein [Thiorhodococcus mannitoliphagus]NEX18852.1 glycosyltransferase family 1 protein [Thiorhodococcus mannitoliphagus]
MSNLHKDAAPAQDARAAIKIAIVTETYPPEINGVANTMIHLTEGLQDRGHEVQLVRPRQQADQGDIQAGPIDLCLVPGLPIPGYRGLRFGLPVYWRLRRIWHRSKPDLIYIATQGPLGHAALSAARALKIPTVTGFHTQFHQYCQHYGLGILSHKIAETLRHFHNRSDATLVPTADLKSQLSADGFENLHVFGRGVDVERFSPRWRSPDLRRSWGCHETDLVALYVGRIAAEKNLDLARDAFEAIESLGIRAKLVLVGDGPELTQMHRERPDFIFTGAKVGAELSAHYASGDLFLFPSLTETFGNVVTEAMASGLPVIAFDYAAAHTHVESGVNGIAIPLDDRNGYIEATRNAASDIESLRRMGAAARSTAEGISWERVLGKVEQRLFEVIARRRGTEACHAAMATSSK